MLPHVTEEVNSTRPKAALRCVRSAKLVIVIGRLVWRLSAFGNFHRSEICHHVVVR